MYFGVKGILTHAEKYAGKLPLCSISKRVTYSDRMHIRKVYILKTCIFAYSQLTLLAQDVPLNVVMFGCWIQRENIFGNAGGSEGDKEEVSNNDVGFGGEHWRRGDERQVIGGDDCGNRADPVGRVLPDNVSRTGDEMNRRFRLGGSIGSFEGCR